MGGDSGRLVRIAPKSFPGEYTVAGKAICPICEKRRAERYCPAKGEKICAIDCGTAFQLTNILRDVAEDAGRNRVYLPLEDLAAHNITVESLLHRAAGDPPTANERALLESIGDRAEYYYRSAEALLPFIDRESRPAMQVLVAVYHALLKRIERADYDVFSQRASVPMVEKVGILAVGLKRMGLTRLIG